MTIQPFSERENKMYKELSEMTIQLKKLTESNKIMKDALIKISNVTPYESAPGYIVALNIIKQDAKSAVTDAMLRLIL